MTEYPELETLKQKLNDKNIFEIRQIARKVGVPQPTTGKKERLVSGIIDIASGKVDPVDPSRFGAPPSSEEYDRILVALVHKVRAQSLNAVAEEESGDGAVLSVAGDDSADGYAVSGFLDRDKGKWIIRTGGAPVNDIFVNDYYADKYILRRGDKVCGTARRKYADSFAALQSVTSVNGCAPEEDAHRREFDELIPVYPEKRLSVSQGGISGRIIDLMCPLGAGQRTLVTAPHGTGKTALLKCMAQGLQVGNDGLKIIVLLIDSRPEEISDFTSSLHGAEVIPCVAHGGGGRVVRLALEYAKRLTERGEDVVLLIDGLSEYARSLELYGMPLADAVEDAKELISCARNIKDGGSLTIVSTVGDGDPLERALYSNLKGSANMFITLSGALARSRVYPPFDLQNTRTLRDENLLTADELKAADILRMHYIEHGTQGIISLFAGSADNAKLCENLLNKN